ncbi:amino acid adenylation domain-containing protein [Rheinheimera sp.]|uniref:amino acid adenylation domain-containing protein n=1 Tax=Rheinheimera sp. TaxID=1869214 RepID=UPI00307F8844
MTALQLLYQVNALGMLLWTERQGDEDKLKFSLRQPLADKEQWLALLKAHKAELIALLRTAGADSEQFTLPAIYPGLAGPWPLSYAQQRLWFLQQYQQDSMAYHIPLLIRLPEARPQQAYQALNTIVQRHQVLRSSIRTSQGQARLELREASALEFAEKTTTDESAIHAELKAETARSFDLEQDLPLRACYWPDYQGKALLMLCLHHIAFDGWSLSCLLQEFSQLFDHFCTGRSLALPDLALQYQDFAYFQHQLLQGGLAEQQWAFWQQQLHGLQTLELPLDHARPASIDYSGASETALLSPAQYHDLLQLARAEHTSLYAVGLSAWLVLLATYSQQWDVVTGTAAANRHYQGTESLIGFFVNSLPVRCQLQPEQSLRQLLAQLHQQLLQLQQHQDLPFDWMVDQLQLPRDPSRHPLFQVFFSLSLQQDDPQSELELLAPEQIYPVAKYDLSLFISQSPAGLALELNYATALFAPQSVRQMLQHYQRILQLFREQPDTPLAQLSLLSAEETQQLLFDFNQSQQPLPQGASMPLLFWQQAALRPEQQALWFNGESLSYRQLDQQSSALAQELKPQLAGQTEAIVALLLERSLELVIAIQAIYKAGAAYLPIALELPQQRQAFLLQDSAASVLLTQNSLLPRLAQLNYSGPVLALDSWRAEPSAAAPAEPPSWPAPAAHQLAYLIYTSGTTGQPKGVMLEHQALLNRLDWMQRAYPIGPGDKVLQKTPYSFDVSVWELLWATAQGAEIVVAQAGGHKDPDYLYQLMEQQQITVVHFVPTMLQAFLDDLLFRGRRLPASLKYLFCSGEALAPATAALFYRLNSQATLHNLYGPTETAIDSSFYNCQPSDAVVPIGYPVQNTQLYVLNPQGALVPKGVAGELCIAGAGVARGYLNRPELSAERFISNPFFNPEQPEAAGPRLYKTGDRVRQRQDGCIEYLGRFDFQIKLRGMRIELAEIEAALCQLPGVSQALVQLQPVAGQQLLIAYCQSPAPLQKDSARQALLQQLPDYMVPDIYVTLERFPVGVNGKLDRQALPPPPVPERGHSAPANATEQRLLCLWQQLLGTEQLGVDDDFFRSGGNSILAIRLCHAMSEVLGGHYPLARLFRDKSIRQVASHWDSTEATAEIPAPQPGQHSPNSLLSFSQRRLWFLQQYDPQNTAYHVPLLFQVQQGQRADYQQVLRQLVERQQILRCLIIADQGEARLALQASDQLQLPEVQLPPQGLMPYLQQLCSTPFDLSQEWPLRVRWLQSPGQAPVLLLLLHHIAFDGWSQAVLQQELTQLLRQQLQQCPAQLPSLPLQYAAYAGWQRHSFAQGKLAPQLQYWQHQLDQTEPLSFPTDRARPARLCYQGDNLIFALPQPLASGLKQQAARLQVSLYSLLLSAFALLAGRYSGQQDLLIGSPFANRQLADSQHLIGCFINTLPLRLHYQPQQRWSDWVARVDATVQQAQQHQDLPFEHLIEQLNLPQDPSRHPLFQLLFSLDQFSQQNTGDSSAALAPFLQPMDLGSSYQVAKYDLSLYLIDQDTTLSGALNFSTALFDRATMQRFSERYLQLLQSALDHQDAAVAELNWWSPADPIPTAPDKASSYRTLPQLFSAQVRRQPDAIALVCEQQQWSYLQLDEASNQLAHYLQQSGLQPGDTVALALSRTEHLILALLAVQKAGAAYLPLSLDSPITRLQFMLDDSQSCLLLTDQPQLAQQLSIDSYNPTERLHQSAAKTALPVHCRAEAPAYLIYTSGSTGQPKGVLVSQASFCDFLLHFPLPLPAQQPVHCLSLTAATFDIFGLEYGLPLVRGGTLYLSCLEQASACLAQHKSINLLQQTPSVLRTLLELGPPDLSGLCCLVGGEALDEDLKQQLLQRFATVLNVYGPTETTIWSSVERCSPDTPAHCIGRALPHEGLYLCSDQGELLPPGVIGELCIGGAGVSLGYLNRPELDLERFVYQAQLQQRLYRTGDLARQRLDGRFDYLGRRDFQVKIRGHRIELAEIEQQLLRYPELQQVLVCQSPEAEPRLIAYFRAKRSLNSDSLQHFLSQQLPAFMLPDCYLQLASFPLNSNGKIDRKALPLPERSSHSRREASTELELQLVALWQQLLGQRPGLDDDFFRLGGNSIKALLLVHQMKAQAGLTVTVADLFEQRTIAALLAQQQTDSSAAPDRQISGPVAASDLYLAPLSSAQQRFWFLQQLEPDSAVYHIPMLLQLGPCQPERLEQALRRLIERHQVLGSVLQTSSQGTCQRYLGPAAFELQRFRAEPAGLAASWQAFIARPFVLEQQLPLRAALWQQADGQHWLLLVLHHIAFDGWSMDLFFAELDAFYQGHPDPLPALPYQYRDFARWQQQQCKAEQLAQHAPYWQQFIEPAALSLPCDKARPAAFDHRGAEIHFSLSPELTAALQQLAEQQQLTLYSLLLSAWAITLQKLCGQQLLRIGTPSANRQLTGTEALIGCFINNLVLQLQIEPQMAADQLMQQAQAQLTLAQRHQDFAFEQLVEQLQLPADPSRHPLFQVMFSVQNFAAKSEQLGWLSPAELPEAAVSAKVDLSLLLEHRPQGLSAVLNYATSLFSAERAALFQRCFVQLLHQLVVNPSQAVADLSLLSPAERSKALAMGQAQQAPQHSGIARHLLSHFRRTVERYPQQQAVILGAQHLSYRQLDQESSQLAHLLRCQGVTAGQFVPLLLPRSTQMMVALLAVLKAGAAWLPLEPDTPTERLQHILQDCQAPLLLSLSSCAPATSTAVLCLDQLDFSHYPTSAPELAEDPGALAYLIYTSGTTGQPKGVMVEHQALLSTLLAQQQQYSFGPDSVLYLGLSYAFDASLAVIWNAWLAGGTLLLTQDIDFNHPDLQRVSHLILSGAVLDALTPQALPALNYLIYGGSAASPAALQRFAESEIYVEYGVTEAAITSSYGRVSAGVAGYAGFALPETSLYILDAALQPVPAGIIGELCIAGPGLARGYLNQPELTAEKFIAHPFEPGQRLYRSGDLACWRADGSLQLCGRADQQIKHRGYRIELADIEQQLQHYPAVQQVAVIQCHQSGRPQLLAYLVAKPDAGPLDLTAVQAMLRCQLPLYMQPDHLMQLAALPLSRNGKLDPARLPRPSLSDSCEPPEGEAELLVARCWQQLLPGSTPGRMDDFFLSGGDSILAMQLLTLLKQAGATLSLKQLMQQRCLARIASALQPAQQQPQRVAEQGVLSGDFDLLPIQRWFFCQVASGRIDTPAYWNQSFLIRVQPLDLQRLQLACDHLLYQHDMLRARFIRTTEGWRQTYGPVLSAQIKLLDRSNCTEQELEQQLSQWQAGFDLEQGPLLQLGYLYNYPDGSARIYLAAHHLLLDAVSWRILLDDLKQLYHGTPLTDKTSSYRQWVLAQADLLPVYPIWYWQQLLQSVPALPLPAATAQARSQHRWSVQETGLLQQQAERLKASVQDLLLMALAQSLAKLTGQSQQLIWLEGHGRQQHQRLDLHRTVGWFTSLFPLRLDAAQDPAALLMQCQHSARLAQQYGQSYLQASCLGLDAAAPVVYLNYLGQLGQSDDDWQLAAQSSGANYPASQQALEPVSVLALQQSGQLQLAVSSRFGELFTDQLLQQLNLQLLQLCQYSLPALPLCYWQYPEFSPYTVLNPAGQHSLFVLPPGEGDPEAFYQPLLQRLPQTRIVLVQNFYRYLAEQSPQQAQQLSFRSLALQLLPLLQHWQPAGPFHLLGWSFGGVLALELATLLEQQQLPLASVQLVDAYFDLPKARASSTALQQALQGFDATTDINGRHQASRPLQQQVRLYKATRLSKQPPNPVLAALEQAYLPVADNFIGAYARQVQIETFAAGHFDAMPAELADLLALGCSAPLTR